MSSRSLARTRTVDAAGIVSSVLLFDTQQSIFKAIATYPKESGALYVGIRSLRDVFVNYFRRIQTPGNLDPTAVR